MRFTYFWNPLIWLICLDFVRSSPEEHRLYDDLLRNYNSLERPVFNSSEPLVVKLRIFLQQILDIDEKNQVMRINAWSRFIWFDYNLKWDPNEYDGIKSVRFPHGTIWKPDILLYNSVDENFDSLFKSNMLVYSTGEVNWIPPAIFKSSCRIDITWFPFDDQLCSLKFSSWTFNGADLDLQIDSDSNTSTHQMDLTDYVENGEWNLLATPAVRHITYYTCCPEPYTTIIFSLHLRRRTLYFGFNLIIPSLLISLMTVLGFTLPPDAGEKITLEITILLSVCLFLSMVADMTPPTSEAVPLLGFFFSCTMLVVSTSVVCTVVVLNLHFRSPDSHVMSPLIRRLLLEWLPWLLMMTRPGYIYKGTEAIEIDLEDDSPAKINVDHCALIDRNDAQSDAQIILLHRIFSELKEISYRMEEEEKSQSLQNDWKFAAMVVDRACLFCFTVFIVISTFATIFSAPHIYA